MYVYVIIFFILVSIAYSLFFFFFQAEDGIRDLTVTGVQTCALPISSRMSEVLSAIPLVQAFAREKYEEEQFDAVTAETVRESIRVARLEAAATRSSEVITAVGTAAAVSFGALLVLKHKMLPGELVVVVGYLTNMYKPMRSLAKLSTDFSKAMASADRISEVLDTEPEIQDRKSTRLNSSHSQIS